ncbi:TlpA disulfide reductase family protein [Plantactinospora sp. KBS50]|uniref:TlpA family protein disulfide reductase n=1 Tax=Plantactinospora sp. KBS50 TaxID=2024580 RepID=UPI000BAAF254|nr:TlpA disulfide reductase family protein [Plantactinospora sp. KBS50]ASW53179.1 alkyl hydroperoxide reductase [Plantactinospora sp. KBS50]
MAGPRRVSGVLAGAVAVLALGTAGCSGDGSGFDWRRDCETTPEGVVQCAPGNRPPPTPISGELLDGGSYDVTQDRGQVVVVNFWGSWCAPCRAEADDLESTYQATRDAGVRFLGINARDGQDAARAFERGRLTYPSLYDPGGKLALGFQVPPNSIPATVILDRAGRIAVVIRRAVRADDLRPVVDRVAAEEPARD